MVNLQALHHHHHHLRLLHLLIVHFWLGLALCSRLHSALRAYKDAGIAQAHFRLAAVFPLAASASISIFHQLFTYIYNFLDILLLFSFLVACYSG